MRVLLVEDDDMVGEAMQLALRQSHFVVDWIRNGKKALEALFANYDMVLLDLGLPGCAMSIHRIISQCAQCTTQSAASLSAPDGPIQPGVNGWPSRMITICSSSLRRSIPAGQLVRHTSLPLSTARQPLKRP